MASQGEARQGRGNALPLPPALVQGLARSAAARIARVSDSRCGHGSSGNRRLFAVDFQGDGLFEPGDIDVDLSASAGTITRQDRYRYFDRKTLRILFELDPGSEKASELRLALRRGQARASETWLYRWTP